MSCENTVRKIEAVRGRHKSPINDSGTDLNTGDPPKTTKDMHKAYGKRQKGKKWNLQKHLFDIDFRDYYNYIFKSKL